MLERLENRLQEKIKDEKSIKKLEGKINDLEIKFEEKINNIKSSVNETNKTVNDI